MFRRSKKYLLPVITVVTLLGMTLPASVAMAVLTVGPIDNLSQFQGNPNTGFPIWYQDQQGTRVTLRNSLNGYPVDAVSYPDGPTAGNAYSQQMGFTSEAFYWAAGSYFNSPAGIGLIEFAIEAINTDEGASGVGGQESVMSRTRIRLDTPTTGTVTVTTPYGNRIFTVNSIGPGLEINFTEDIGAIPRDFLTAAAGSPFTNFIRPVTQPTTPGLIGDGISVGPAMVGIGGPLAVVTIKGAGLDITATDWTVTGHLFPNAAPGDANSDDVINALDITKIERIVVGLDAPTAGADANQDGNINAIDITRVERIIAGLP